MIALSTMPFCVAIGRSAVTLISSCCELDSRCSRSWRADKSRGQKTSKATVSGMRQRTRARQSAGAVAAYGDRFWLDTTAALDRISREARDTPCGEDVTADLPAAPLPIGRARIRSDNSLVSVSL